MGQAAVLFALVLIGIGLCSWAIVRAERRRPRDSMVSVIASAMIGIELGMAFVVGLVWWWLGEPSADWAMTTAAAVLALLAGSLVWSLPKRRAAVAS